MNSCCSFASPLLHLFTLTTRPRGCAYLMYFSSSSSFFCRCNSRLSTLHSFSAAAGLTSYGDSPIFQDDWLGEASPDNDFHTVDKGRWAFLPVMRASAGWLESTTDCIGCARVHRTRVASPFDWPVVAAFEPTCYSLGDSVHFVLFFRNVLRLAWVDSSRVTRRGGVMIFDESYALLIAAISRTC